jgi:predicted lipoprotein
MNSRILKPFSSAISIFMSIVVLAGGSALNAPEASAALGKSKMSAPEKRAALHKLRDDTLEDFYATKPEIKDEVANAVGYAVFDASQVNVVLFVGSLGGGVLTENKTAKETFMKMKRLGSGSRPRIQIVPAVNGV